MFGLLAGTAEEQAGALLRRVLMGLAVNATAAPTLAPYSLQTHTINVLNASGKGGGNSGPSGPSVAFTAVSNFKRDLCGQLAGLGFDARFWWIN